VVLRLLTQPAGTKTGFAQEELPMKRSTARWTTALAAAALIGVPAAGWSQTPPAATSQAPTAQQPAAGANQQQGAAADEIRQAEAALNDIPSSTLPARAKSRIAEVKRHLNALGKAAATSPAPGSTGAKKNSWSNDVAAIDKALTELLGSDTGAPGASTGATGTTGSTQPKPAAAPTLDEATKAKLMEVRQHVTAFAASMSGTGSSVPKSPSEASAEPSAAAAQAPAATASQAPAATAAQAPSATPSPTAESTPPASSASPASPQQSSAAAPAAAEQTQAQEQTPAAAPASQVDEEAAKRHLTAARDSLAQLTQLPAAAQLSGETRTQVSQLITNFNELITSKADWRAAYDKVNANVMAIIGADSAPVEPAAPPTGTPGAVGTAGTTPQGLDPAIRGKLVEFRSHLVQFEKAAGTSPSSGSDKDMNSSSSSSSPSSSEPAASASSTPSSSPSPSASPSNPPAESSPASEPAASSSAADQSAAQGSASKVSQDSAIRHIEAIEAILSGREPSASSSTPGATPGSAGTTGSAGSKLTLERAQVEQIRMHLAELRKAVEKK
jgi:mucin-6/19